MPRCLQPWLLCGGSPPLDRTESRSSRSCEGRTLPRSQRSAALQAVLAAQSPAKVTRSLKMLEQDVVHATGVPSVPALAGAWHHQHPHGMADA